MRIAINARFLLSNKLEGLGWYTYEITKRLVEQHPDVEFVLFFDRAFDNRFAFGPNVTPVVLRPPARHPFLWIAWFEWSIRRALAKHNPDVFFSPDGFLCLGTDVPSVPVIHDLNFEHDGWFMPRLVRWYYRTFMPEFASTAAHVITISDFCRDDIHDRYHVAREQITRIYNGVNQDFHVLSPEQRSAVQHRVADGDRYFVVVGAQHARKNIARMLMAFDRYCDTYGATHRLVLAGSNSGWDAEIMSAYNGMKHQSRVVISGHLPQAELVEVVGSADALLFVSLFEGFGLPAVEAMRAGVPVITSTTSCLPEVVADAALLCDPMSIDAICSAMHRITGDASQREQLIAAGHARAEAFSWDHAAEQVWNVLTAAARTTDVRRPTR